ncbi:MAG: type II secretion system protein [Burkholderiaceae bacterium]|nr:type II secretion system protein [Burkholderiaceae bacterium]
MHAVASRRRRQGFTLIESIGAIILLGIAAAGIVTVQSGVFNSQNRARYLAAGVELQQACAERLVGVRNQQGYSAVATGLCSGVGSGGGFSAPTYTLTVGGTSTSPCSGSTCTAVISVSPAASAAAAPPNLTLQFSSY